MIIKQYPSPKDQGDNVRSYNIAKQFSKHHNIYYLNFSEPNIVLHPRVYTIKA